MSYHHEHDVESLTKWKVQLRRVRHAVLPSFTSRPNPLAVGHRHFISIFSPGAAVCLDLHTRRIIWRRALVPFGAAHILHKNERLYAKTFHTLYCLEPDTGRTIWSFCPYGTDDETMYSAPSVKDGRLFIGDRRGFLHALDADSGSPIWHVLTSRAHNNDVNGPPLPYRDRVLVATNAGRLFAIKGSNGDMIWSTNQGVRTRSSQLTYACHWFLTPFRRPSSVRSSATFGSAIRAP